MGGRGLGVVLFLTVGMGSPSGRYANSTRGRLRKRQQVDPIPTVLEPPISSEAFRRNWARLIQKVFEEDSYSQLPTVEEDEFSQLPPPQWDC